LKPAGRFGPKRHPAQKAFWAPGLANRRYKIDTISLWSDKASTLVIIVNLIVVADIPEL
jgi:hypothetical protein